jgi:hypothetical protein
MQGKTIPREAKERPEFLELRFKYVARFEKLLRRPQAQEVLEILRRNKPISDLRRRLLADMTIRSFSDKTRRDHIRHVEAMAAFLGRSPDTATGDDLRRFQQHQVEQGAQPPTMNSQASALRVDRRPE